MVSLQAISSSSKVPCIRHTRRQTHTEQQQVKEKGELKVKLVKERKGFCKMMVMFQYVQQIRLWKQKFIFLVMFQTPRGRGDAWRGRGGISRGQGGRGDSWRSRGGGSNTFRGQGRGLGHGKGHGHDDKPSRGRGGLGQRFGDHPETESVQTGLFVFSVVIFLNIIYTYDHKVQCWVFVFLICRLAIEFIL